VKKLIYILPLVFTFGCASYYQRNIEVQRLISAGDLEKAEKTLEGDKRIQKDRNRK